MDGVLVDNAKTHAEAYAILGERYDIPNRYEAHKMMGLGADVIYKMLFCEKADLYNEAEISAEKEDIYRELITKSIEPTTGLIDFLEELKRNNIKMAVGSSGPIENVNFVLDKCNIAKYFDAVVHRGLVSNAKPDPEIFLTAAKLIELPSENCIVIEDAVVGIQAAQRASMKCVALATTFTRELLIPANSNLIVDDFTSLNFDIINNL